MATTTAAIGGEETSEQKEARIKANRAAGAAKAREARAAKLTENPDAEKNKKNKFVTDNYFWMQIFVTLMQNKEVKTVKDVPSVIKETNAVVELLEEEGQL